MNQITCGIDWAEGHHDIALLDHEGQLVTKKRIIESVDGFVELITLLTEAGDSAESPIPVAIETPRGLLVAALRATGRPIYAINPMAVARYRERHSQSRKKSDHADAMALANILRTDAPMRRCTVVCLPIPISSVRSRYWPGRIRTPRGDAAAPPTSCAPCCVSTSPASCRRSPLDRAS